MKSTLVKTMLDAIVANKSPIDSVLYHIIVANRLECGFSSASADLDYYTNSSEADSDNLLKKLQEQGYLTGPIWQGRPGSFALLEDNKNKCVKMYVKVIPSGSNAMSVLLMGEACEVEKMKQQLDKEFKKEGSFIRTAQHIDANSRTVVFSTTFLDADTVQVAHQSFYPWLGVPLSEYFDAFMDSSESVLVLFGPPGTGKSTFLRSLIAHKNYTAMLAYNKEVVVSHQLINQYYRAPKSRILAYEDIDNHLSSREEGNTLMSTILNASEGVVKFPGKKIVFSANLNSIDKIDPALLRKGRCFDILRFELLTQDEARAVLVDMKMPDRDLSEKDYWSLSEIMNPSVGAQQAVNRFKKPTGFY